MRQDRHAGSPGPSQMVYDASMKLRAFTILFVLLFSYGASSQEALTQLRQLMKDDRSAIDGLVLYPPEFRDAIFEVSAHPEVMATLSTMQQKSSAAFEKMIEALPAEDQKRVWDIVRYPGLVSALVSSNRSQEKIQASLAKFPSEIHDAALKVGMNQAGYDALTKINELQNAIDTSFADFKKTYPEVTREAMTKMLQAPGALNLLSSNMNVSILLGRVYLQDPEFSRRRAEDVAKETIARNAKSAEDWMTRIKASPKAWQEGKKALLAFAADSGYSETEVRQPITELKDTFSGHPYPYWFGSPVQGAGATWYRYPFWHHSGFYFAPNKKVVIIGPPSAEYLRWHFRTMNHLAEYPNLTEQLLAYYEKYGETNHAFGSILGNWEGQQRDVLSGSWLRPDAGRVERLKVFAMLNEDYQKAKAQDPVGISTRVKFFEANSEKYSALNVTSLSASAKSIELPENVPPPTETAQSLQEDFEIQQAPSYELQAQAEDYMEGSWDADARRRYYETRIP